MQNHYCMSCRGLQEGNEEIVSTILRWLGDECADKKHDGHDHEHLFAIASWPRRYGLGFRVSTS